MNYEKAKAYAKKHAEFVKKIHTLSAIWHKNDTKKKPWTFTKKLTAFLIANCLVIEIYALITMWHFMDLTALAALIAAVVGECIMACAYVIKSTYENRAGGIVYETALRETFHLPNEMTEKEKEEAVG